MGRRRSRPSAFRGRLDRLSRSTATLAVLAGVTLATSSAAAAVLTGALGSGATPGAQASASAASNTGCPAAYVAPSAPVTPGGVPIVFSSMYPSAGLPQGGTQVTVSGSGFGNTGNPDIWALFDFGYDPSGQGVLVTVEASVVNNTTIDIPSTPPEENGNPNPAVYLATPDSWVLTTTPRAWELFNVIGPLYFTYTNTPPPTTTTTTVSPTTTSTTSTTIAPTYYTPIVNAVDPSTGITSGGTVVSIVGVDFQGALQVTFGGVPATSFTVVNSGLISAVAPPGTAGSVGDVEVTTPVGTSAPGQQDRFTWATVLPQPQVKVAPKGC